ncbi:MAG: HAD hydrolase-like protein [Prevotella sp.]|jgi:putative hydrolase of the HAD superfamily|nr:HAD hydrolase-like protein [Prevotella sp.]
MAKSWKVIAFDADDTLWDCQTHFEQVEKQLYALIAPYCDNPARELFETESGNMADLGYGCKAFTISVVETALRVGGDHLSAAQVANLLHESKRLLQLPATPLPGVEETLRTMREREPAYKMVCFTKGELQDQENKLKRSGLAAYFDDVMITSDKSQREFRELCDRHHCHPSDLLMVGNSLKSDIAPALAIGAWALHIPFHVTWQLEVHEEFDHERMRKIERFSDVLNYI